MCGNIGDGQTRWFTGLPVSEPRQRGVHTSNSLLFPQEGEDLN